MRFFCTFMLFGAQVQIAGPGGHRVLPLAKLYIGHARQDRSFCFEGEHGGQFR